MAGEVVVDALPYFDQGYDETGVREAVCILILILQLSGILKKICKSLYFNCNLLSLTSHQIGAPVNVLCIKHLSSTSH